MNLYSSTYQAALAALRLRRGRQPVTAVRIIQRRGHDRQAPLNSGVGPPATRQRPSSLQDGFESRDFFGR